MATRILPREIEVEEYCWGEIYKGSKPALVAAGLAEPRRFPGDPGNNKVMQTFYEGDRKTVVRRASKTKYHVWLECSKEEEANRLAKAKAEKARRVEAERQLGLRRALKQALDALPKSKAEYMAWFERISIPALNECLGAARNGSGGYRCSAHSVSEIEGALHDVVEALRAAEITFDSRARRKLEDGVRMMELRADPAFAAFMQSMSDKPIDPGLAAE